LYEGFGRPVLEAMTCACPVLASDVTSIPEVAGDAALSVDPYDVDAMAEAMARIVTDRDLHDDLAERGLARCRLFSIEKMVDQTVAVLNSLRPAPERIATIETSAATVCSAACAVVVNLNAADDTLACLTSLAGQTKGVPRTVVVDNGSRDDEFQKLARAVRSLGWVRLVRSPVNLHFARGYNLGIEHARAARSEQVLLVNNDAVCASDLLEQLAAVLDAHPEVGLVGPRICRRDRPEVIETDGFGGWLPLVLPRPHGVGRPDAEPRPDAHACTYVTGCCMLVRARVLEQVGAFEPEFWSYYEDWDLNRRIQAAGHQTWHVPGARLWHKQAATIGHRSPAQYFLTSRNRVLMARRHLRASTRRLVFWPATLLMNLAVSAKLCLTGAPRAARAVWQGTFGRPGPVEPPPEPGPEVEVIQEWTL
jgi:GT2 family glycosyltransferase